MKKLAGLAAVLAVFALASAVHAQSPTGRIDGVVADPSGAVIPGATVMLFGEGPPIIERETESDEGGRYHFADLLPGRYSIAVHSAGFVTVNMVVDVVAGEYVFANAVLGIGALTETVAVVGVATALQTESTSVGTVKRSRVFNLPIHGRIYGNTVHLGPSSQSAENYSLIEENGFHAARQTPLSTFAADVDTASYSNVRRFLNDGRLPPKDAVRIEELINYFRYEGQDPDGEHPVRIEAETAICPWNDKNKLARISVRTQSINFDELPPINLVFLLDVSGSMSSPDKLPLLKRSLALLTRQLRPQDSVAITVYAGAAGLVLRPTSGEKQDKILAALDRLAAGGSTAGAAGIQLAYQTARASFREDGVNRVILATDGDFNVGVSTESELIRLIEKERESGVFLSVLGFGTGNLQDSKMEQLADHGNGAYAYIDTLLEARRALVEQVGATLATVAKDVKLQVEFNPFRVDSYRLVGYENRLLAAEDFNDDEKDAGEMGAGHIVTALYEIQPKGGRSDQKPSVDDLRYQKPRNRLGDGKDDELLTVKVRYKQPDGDESRLMVRPLSDQDQSISQTSDNFRFAAAVAEFGLLLRDSKFKKRSSFENVVRLAESARGEDADGYRTEFVYLAKKAAGLSNEEAPSVWR